MASGPHWEKARGSYRVQWFDGYRWRRKTVYRVPGWKKGQPEPKKVPPEAMAALKLFADKERAARGNRPIDPSTTVADFLGAYRSTYSREHAARSLEQVEQASRCFLAWAAHAGVSKLDQVTTAACQEFLDWLAGQSSRKTGGAISPRTVHQRRNMLAGAWSRAVRIGTIPANPWRATRAPGWEKFRNRKSERYHWSPEQFERLLAAARPWLRDVLVLGTQTGLRISALCGLEWRDVRWGRGGGLGEVVIRPELDKCGRGYSVPISRKAHDLLARLEAARPPDRETVLSGRGGQAASGRVTFDAIRRACRRAGLQRPSSPNHHMRRSFGRWAVLGQLTGRPVPLYVVMRWLGHTKVETTMIYLDLTDADNRDWMTDVSPTETPPSATPDAP